MNRRYNATKLEVKLIVSIIISLSIAVIFALFINNVVTSSIDNYFNNSNFLKDKGIRAVSDFKSYISESNVSIKDYSSIEKWARKHKYIDLYIYDDNDLVFKPTRYSENDNVTNPMEYINSSAYFNEVAFADKVGKVYMDCYFEYKYYYIIVFVSAAIGLIFFIIIILILLKRKISYIGKLENEIRILEGGDLNYNITIEGNDELASLATGINEMRKSFIERLESEVNAQNANSELITAISHDLRTPLTALLGYMDIIEYKKYKTEENLIQYIHNSREKAYQIKSLSDKLFEYFTVFNTNDNIDYETFDGNELLAQLFDEEFFMLSEEGFSFDYEYCENVFDIDLNLISIRRVFDNIFSNISKYGDRSEPVKVKYSIEEKGLIIEIKNKIDTNLKEVSSTGIGLKSCEKIIEMHGGKLEVEKTDYSFSVIIKLVIN